MSDSRPALRDLYADDPDDIFDADDVLGADDGGADAEPDGEPDAELDGVGELVDGAEPAAGEPVSGGPGGDDPEGPDVPAGPDSLSVVDRPVTPGEVDGGYGVDLASRDGRLVRPVLFDGVPSREQAVQGALGDCGVIAALGAVAGHRPEAVRDLVSVRPEGGYLVRLHQVEPDGRGVFVPTGERIGLVVTPELPVRREVPYYAAFADTYRTGVSWAAVLEKALAGVDGTWSQAQAADRVGASGYVRLRLGSRAGDQAEWLAMLTGQPAAAVPLDRTQGREPVVERWLRAHLDAGNPVLANTRQGDEFGTLPHRLVGLHAYEVVGVEDGRISLHNPWGDRHPDPMSVRDFLDNTLPRIATTWNRETT